MTEVSTQQGSLEPQKEVSKVAEAIISSSSDEEDVPVVKKQAATKRRTYRPVSTDAVPSCGIYSTHQSKEGLGDLKFTTLPQGFKLDDDEEEDEDDLILVNSKYRKILPRTPKLSERDLNSDISLISEGTPEKFTSTQRIVRSPSPPPPPALYMAGQSKKTSKKVNNMLRQLDHNILSYRITNALNDSSPMTTPGGNSKAIDLESPSLSPGKRRKQMTVKIRSRGGVQKFIMQMDETFSNVIDTLAQVEGVSKSWVKLVKGDDDISEFNTPRNANIRISDILECVIIDPSIVPAADESELELNITPCLDDMVEIKIQGQDRASKRTFTVAKDQPLGEIMTKYSESCGTPLERLKFMFDGDVINVSETPEDLDMDEEGVIDVVFIS